MTSNHLAWTVTHTLQALGIADAGMTHTALAEASKACARENVDLLRELRYTPDALAERLDNAREQDVALMVARLVLTGATLTELLNVTEGL